MCPNLLKYLQKTLRGGSVYRQGSYNALTYPGYYDNAFQAISDCKNIYEDKLAYLNVHLEKLRLEAEDMLKGKKIIAIEAIK